MSVHPFELRGNNLAIQTMNDEEILLSGPAGTGKTLAILKRLNDVAWQYPGARILIVRKVRADLAQTTLVTFERDILGFNNPICHGVRRENRQSYRYPNGSEIVVGGMDRPGKILSGEYHVIYAAEATEFELTDWEFFLMRLGRDGVVPFAQIIADTNPAYPTHWLKQRADAGLCRLLPTFHTDNAAYYEWDQAGGKWVETERGRRYMGKLQRLTGVRRLRYLDGKWVQAEGAVYADWDENIHYINAFPIPRAWKRFRAIDEGYTNPFVCLWFAQDPDGRLYVYRQIYKTRRLVEDHARDIVQLSTNEDIAYTVADWDAEDRATLERHGVPTLPAEKGIISGIQAVQERLRIAGDGKPRLFVLRGSLAERDEDLAEGGQPVDIVGEFGAYVWQKTAEGRAQKEVPIDLWNHAMDALRYGVVSVDVPLSLREGEVPDAIADFFGGSI